MLALRRDRALESIAQREATEAARTGEAELSGKAAALALQQAPGVQRAAAELYVGGGPDMVTVSKNIAEPRWTRLGIGAVYAGSRQNGAGRLWVVLLYGR